MSWLSCELLTLKLDSGATRDGLGRRLRVDNSPVERSWVNVFRDSAGCSKIVRVRTGDGVDAHP